jgi:hypothetical protein
VLQCRSTRGRTVHPPRGECRWSASRWPSPTADPLARQQATRQGCARPSMVRFERDRPGGTKP